ncbi:MAG TPA: circularly permuted type 2 ATP-grasp protein, partial [Solirubrobacterales bacterium]
MSAPPYSPEPGCYDEAYDSEGEPRPHYAALLETLSGELETLPGRVEAGVAANGLTFGEGLEITVDPVPRLLTAAEWERLQAGLLQRVRALNAFIVDAYGPQRIFDAGVVPRRLLQSSSGYLGVMQGHLDSEVPPATVAGLDLVRGRDGEFHVLEDNLRMPSGITYATTLRAAVAAAVDWPLAPRPLDGFARRFGDCLRAAAPA